MRIEQHIELPNVGIIKVIAYMNCANEALYSYCFDNTGEHFDPSEKQIEYINEKLNEGNEVLECHSCGDDISQESESLKAYELCSECI